MQEFVEVYTYLPHSSGNLLPFLICVPMRPSERMQYRIATGPPALMTPWLHL